MSKMIKGLLSIFVIVFIILINDLKTGTSVYTFTAPTITSSPEVIRKIVSPTNTLVNRTFKSGDIIGIISIDKINLNLPVLEGVTEKNLKISACHIPETKYPWEVGNSFISAHRSWTYGKLFNRLDELEIGDIIKFSSDNFSKTYRVFNIIEVDPDNTDVFYMYTDSVLTLTTCTPMYKATKRLIIFAK